MDHKDFLDDVIKGMTSNTNETKPIEQEDSIDGMIKLKMSTGETFLIDPTKFDWDTAMKEFNQLDSNADQIRNMMFSVLNGASDEDIDTMTSQLMAYLEGYQIDPEYERFDHNISKEKRLMLRLFDTSTIIAEMSKNISLYYAISMFTKSDLGVRDLIPDTDKIIPDGVHLRGVSDTYIEDGLDMNPIQINGSDVICYEGDIVVYGDSMFILSNDKWTYVGPVTEDDTENDDDTTDNTIIEQTDRDEPINEIRSIFIDDVRTNSGLIDE